MRFKIKYAARFSNSYNVTIEQQKIKIKILLSCPKAIIAYNQEWRCYNSNKSKLKNNTALINNIYEVSAEIILNLVNIASAKKAIEYKLLVASVIQGLKVIKIFTNNTCLRLVITKETTILAVELLDMVRNYWFIVEHIIKDSKEVISILDDLYLEKPFKERDKEVSMALIGQDNSARYLLWHGKSQFNPGRLIKLTHNLIDALAIKKVDALISYINNIKRIVNYQQHQDDCLSFNGQLITFLINSIIKQRQKNKKRPCINSSEHNLLCINIVIFSKIFDRYDNAIDGTRYKEVA